MMTFLSTVLAVIGGILIGVHIREQRDQAERLSEDQLRSIYRREHQRDLDGRAKDWE